MPYRSAIQPSACSDAATSQFGLRKISYGAANQYDRHNCRSRMASDQDPHCDNHEHDGDVDQSSHETYSEARRGPVRLISRKGSQRNRNCEQAEKHVKPWHGGAAQAIAQPDVCRAAAQPELPLGDRRSECDDQLRAVIWPRRYGRNQQSRSRACRRCAGRGLVLASGASVARGTAPGRDRGVLRSPWHRHRGRARLGTPSTRSATAVSHLRRYRI